MSFLKKLLLSVAHRILSYPSIRNAARQLWSETNLRADTSCVDINIIEVRPLHARPSNYTGSRINLLLPGISLQHFFGGAATAIDFFERLLPYYSAGRIIVIDEVAVGQRAGNKASLSWPLRSLDDDDDIPYSIVVAGARDGLTLPVSEGDVFVGTAWWTAHLAKSLLDWQSDHFNISVRKFAYLIQDYEAGFYPWSSRWLLADASYRDSKRTVAVFNTSQLAHYFEREGYSFPRKYVFEPRLNKKLLDALELSPIRKIDKKRIILVYGRPNVERNAFEILMQGLQKWTILNPELAELWEVLSVGYDHESIPIQGGNEVHSIGKLSIEDYSDLLRRASVGVSLMVSPHPSYPPLEMAAFGLAVISNVFGVKNPAELHPLIRGLEMVTADTIANALTNACIEFESILANPDIEINGSFAMPYLSNEDQFPFAEEIVRELT